MDIIQFTKTIKYKNFICDIIECFSENAAIYNILKNHSNPVNISGIVSKDYITYVITGDNNNLDTLAKLFNGPITIFGSTLVPTVSRSSTDLKVIFVNHC